ncbi:MAG: chitinase [Acidobacteriota bacterium]|jgi:chitinase|nr:chitinase [Acidobacteriota bacterium]
MPRWTKILLILEISILGLGADPAAAQARRFVGYYAEWTVYGANFVPANIPADSLTHVNYAFLDPSDPDGDGYYDCAIGDTWAALQKPLSPTVPGTTGTNNLGTLAQLRQLRTYQQSRGKSLRLIFAVGGASDGASFSALAVDAAHRQHFVTSCIQLMQQQSFDGLDLDWEYPAPTEINNFTLLLRDLRNGLTAAGNNPRTGTPYLLTMDGPAGYYADRYDAAAVAPLIDWMNVMTYDFAGCWGMTNTGHNSPLKGSANDPEGSSNDDQDAIQDWITRGVPAAKINFGLPYYGKAFQALLNAGPNPSYPGRYATINSTQNDYPTCAQGTWGADGDLDYWDLVQRYVNLNGYSRIWDAEQRVPFLWKNLASYWISYDDPTSIGEKVDWAKGAGLGGIFVWELSMERAPGATVHPLTDAAAAHLNP